MMFYVITPLHLAIKLDFTEAVELLLKSGADVNAVDCSGSSAIHMAVQGRSTPILRLLMEKCPDVQLNNRNIDGLTPLHTAVDNGDLEQAELLLSHGADIDVTDGKSGRTPLFRAAESNHKPMVELLLKRGANAEVPSYAGVTVSMAAQGRNLHGVLKLLGSLQDKFGLEASSATSKSLSSTPIPPLLYVGYSVASKSCPITSSVVNSSSNIEQAQPCTISLPASVNSSVQSPLPTAHYQPAEDEKRESPEQLTYLVRPQSQAGRVDRTSGGVMLERADAGSVTKVFHNIFMLTDEKKGRVHMESVSEPSSPDARMEEDGETRSGRKDRPKGGGLLSLPETIDIAGEDNLTRKESAAVSKISTLESKMSKPAAMVIRRVAVGSPKSHTSSGKEAIHNVPGLYRGRVSNDGVIHLVPSSSVPVVLTPTTVPSSPVSRPGVSRLALPPSSTLATSWKSQEQAATSSSPILVPVLSSPLPSSKPSSPLQLPSSPKLGAAAQEGESTSTSLSSIQAKLYETLLRRSQSQPGSLHTPRETGRASPLAASSSIMSKMLLAPVQPLSVSASPSSPSGVVSYRVIPNSSARAVIEPLSVRRGSSTAVTPIRIPSLAHAGKNTLLSSLASSPPGTPLNLSKSSPSRRQDHMELSDSSVPTSPSAQSFERPSSTPSLVAAPSLSFGFEGQYAMPVKQQSQEGEAQASPVEKGVGVISQPVTLKAGSPRSSIVLDSETVENISKGELNLSNFPHVSKCVSDFLSRRSQLIQKTSLLSSFSLPSATSTSSISTVPGSLVAKNLISSHHPPGRIIPLPTSLAQNKIVGLSGAVLSNIAASKGFTNTSETVNHQSDNNGSDITHLKKKSQRSKKEQGVRKPRNKGANKSQPSDVSGSASSTNSVSVSGEPIPNLSKINSVTDEKLKKFLVAKRQEGLMPANARGGEWPIMESGKKDEEEEAAPESPDESNSLKTVGIFSGNVQKFRLGKTKGSLTQVITPSSNAQKTLAIPVPVCAILATSPTMTVSSSDLSKTQSEENVSTTSAKAMSPIVTNVLARETPAGEGESHPAVTDETNSESLRDEAADNSEEEPMEIDISAESSSSSPTADRTDDSSTIPRVSDSSSNLAMPKVQIVVQSPTPPLPSETNDPLSEAGSQEQKVTKEGQDSQHAAAENIAC
ncbi:B-cell lymphoma 3 protein [Elysia marginata]|uniref:B-cell lymphoma 3 protein n=1 Tax=Elysia marginata TaxID=1093978 RepID=A0AAV4H930_9GAST|nr:B-cell lymphoma 3 protein [Elysia marginata]